MQASTVDKNATEIWYLFGDTSGFLILTMNTTLTTTPATKHSTTRKQWDEYLKHYSVPSLARESVRVDPNIPNANGVTLSFGLGLLAPAWNTTSLRWSLQPVQGQQAAGCHFTSMVVASARCPNPNCMNSLTLTPFLSLSGLGAWPCADQGEFLTGSNPMHR
jgi:hypothetical protein